MEDCVLPEFGCPKCGERNADHLVWIDDERVKCVSCGETYFPAGKGFVVGIAFSRNGK